MRGLLWLMCPLEGESETLVPPSLFSQPAHEVRSVSLPRVPAIMWSKSNGPIGLQTDLPRTAETQINFSLSFSLPENCNSESQPPTGIYCHWPDLSQGTDDLRTSHLQPVGQHLECPMVTLGLWEEKGQGPKDA